MSVPFLENYNFLAPYWLLGLTLLPIMAAWYLSQREKRYVNLNLPSLEAFEKSSLRGRLRVLLPILRALTVVTLFIAMARPQLTLQEEEITADGVDIMMVMDLSSSMLAQDFTPDRLEVSKDVAADFIDKRKYILLVFWGYRFFGQYLFVLSNRALCRVYIILLLRTYWVLWLSPLEFKRQYTRTPSN